MFHNARPLRGRARLANPVVPSRPDVLHRTRPGGRRRRPIGIRPARRQSVIQPVTGDSMVRCNRPTRCRPVHALVGVLLLVSAFVSACDRETPPPSGPQVAADTYLKPDTEDVRGQVPPDSNLTTLMRTHLTAAQAGAAVRTITAVFDARRLGAHQPFVLTRTLSGVLRAFRYEIDDDSYLTVG